MWAAVVGRSACRSLTLASMLPALSLPSSSCTWGPTPAALLSQCRQEQARQQRWWHWGGLATTAAAAIAAAAVSGATFAASADAPSTSSADSTDGVSADHSKLLSLHRRQRIFFKYEHRIRNLSSMEKVFEYFASERGIDSGMRFMTARDLVRALVPTYPPKQSDVERAGYLDGERAVMHDTASLEDSVFKRIDANGDGLIGFAEYVLVVQLLSIPEDDVHTVFDVVDMDDSGFIDAAEFGHVMQMLERRAGVQNHFVPRVGKHSASTDGGVSSLTARFFGEDHKEHVDVNRFRTFLQDLHTDMLRLEFNHYDVHHSKTMLGADFATSLCTPADIKHVDRYLDRVDVMDPLLADARLSFQDFAAVAHIRRHLHQLHVALDFCHQVTRPVTRQEFVKLLGKTLGVKLSPAVVDIIMYVFEDPTAPGHLDSMAFVDVMQRRQRLPGTRTSHLHLAAVDGEVGLLGRWWSCLMQCTLDPSQGDVDGA